MEFADWHSHPSQSPLFTRFVAWELITIWECWCRWGMFHSASHHCGLSCCSSWSNLESAPLGSWISTRSSVAWWWKRKELHWPSWKFLKIWSQWVRGLFVVKQTYIKNKVFAWQAVWIPKGQTGRLDRPSNKNSWFAVPSSKKIRRSRRWVTLRRSNTWWNSQAGRLLTLFFSIYLWKIWALLHSSSRKRGIDICW